MDGKNCGCFRRQLKFNCVGIDTKCFGVTVHKDRLKTIPYQTVGTGVKSETWKDHFAFKTQCLQGEHESRRATGHCDTMWNPEILFSGFFKLANESRVRELTAAQNLAHVAEEFFARKSFRRHNGQALFEQWVAACNCRNVRLYYRHVSAPDCSGRFGCLPISTAGTPATSTPSATFFNTTAPAPI